MVPYMSISHPKEGLVAQVLYTPFSFIALPRDCLMPAGRARDRLAFHENNIP